MTADDEEEEHDPAPAAESEVWLAVLGRLANLTHNWDQSRAYRGSYARRAEGFTEAWGVGGRDDDDGDEKHDDWAADEARSVPSILSTPYPRRAIVLHQYRPAWEEQLALRVLRLPFVVVNSRSAVWEAAGPLPCLCETPSLEIPASAESRRRGGASRCRPPCLVGQRQKLPGRPRPPGAEQDERGGAAKDLAAAAVSHENNSILRYLQETHLKEMGHDDWDRGLLTAKQRAVAALFVELVTRTLEPCLAALQLDASAREQVYRHQSRQASLLLPRPDDQDGGSRRRPSLLASLWTWWQGWGERAHVGRRLDRQTRLLTARGAVRRAWAAYALLERHLVELHGGGGDKEATGFFMATPEPVLVDIVLWGSLARALADVHLVTALADFPALCRYAQHVWDSYFDAKPAAAAAGEVEDWRAWNARENARNAFAAIPLLPPPSRGAPQDFADAVELMKRLSLRGHDLHEQLALARGQERDRAGRPAPYGCASSARPLETLHRWRFGGSFLPDGGDGDGDGRGAPRRPSSSPQHHREDAGSSSSASAKAHRREYERHDEFWLATVLAATAAAALLFGVAG